MEQEKRLGTLDGFRAIAILAVIGFHYFVRWTPPDTDSTLYPYGSYFAKFPLFNYGYLGVEIFFIISGFVIAMTLFRSHSMANFVRRRFSRLFPTMLLCSVATYTALHLLPQTAFHPSWRDFFPSLTFTDPIFWRAIFRGRVQPMDGVYWSLFVEVKFYFWIGLLYFGLRGRNFFLAVAAGFGVLLGLLAVMRLLQLPHTWLIEFVFAADSLPWFVSGIAFFSLYSSPQSMMGWLLLGEALIGLLVLSVGKGSAVANATALVLGYSLFLAMLYRPFLVRWCGSAPLTAVGTASYSLYLLHQEIGVSLLQWLSNTGLLSMHPWLGLAVAGALVVVMILLSLAIYRYWEAPAKSWLMGLRVQPTLWASQHGSIAASARSEK